MNKQCADLRPLLVRGKRIWGAALIIFALGVLTWAFLQPHDPLFRGRRESAWISGIVYRGEDAQTKQWIEFGPDGIRMLSKGLNQGNGLLERACDNTWQRLPAFFRSHLPRPADHASTRMCAAWVLCQMGTNAQPALPALLHSLQIETRGSVRCIVVDCFEKLLPQMDEQQKLQYLPFFLKGLKSRDEGERNNSAIALRFYSVQKDVVAPALARTLHDSSPHVCLVAAQSFCDIDPAAADRADVVPVVITYLKNSDNQIAMRAAQLLGSIHRRPDIAVPALIEISQGTDYNVAASALYALGNYKDKSVTILPVLQGATNHSDGRMRRAARIALQQMQPAAPGQQNPK